MDPTLHNSYTHTRALLNYLFTTYSNPRNKTSPPQPNQPLSLLESSVRKLALAQSRAASASSSSKAPSEVSSSTDDEEGGGGGKSGGSTSSVADDLSEEEKTRIVVRKLEDGNIDEDDMPDALKDTLTTLLYLPEQEHVNLDSHILNLLHRHREDTHPSGNPLPPLPNHGSVTPGSRPSVSRSSSFRRHGTSGALTPGSRTPSNNPNLSSSISNASSSRSPAGSPWSSPKLASLALNPNTSAFKFSVGASEFRPGGPGGPGSGHASPSTPGTPNRIRSPMPMTAQQAQQNWALHHSPLGTPKHSVPPSRPGSAVSSPSYFPRQLDVKAALAANKTKIPRVPWGDVSDSSGADNEEDDFSSSARIDDAPLPHESTMAFHQGGAASPFYSPGIPIDRSYPSGEAQWAEQNTQGDYFPQPSYPPQALNEYGEYVGPGSGYASPYYPQDGTHTPTHGGLRPVPSAPGPAFITLPGPAPGEMPSIDFANQLEGSSGLGGIGAYAMTPFDHLHSIFADSDVSEDLLEEALNATGFDVDSSIEYIIDQQIGSRPPGFPPPLDPNASLLDGLPQNRMISSSGSRPLVISRDSFDGFGRGDGGRGSPRWAGSRPETPTGEGRGVGGRVCRFYLAGNCLRSDCKFSHDVGKAVCKFWLRGHCLKGDGRCDFLHTIPPVMRADYENRTRERQMQMQGPPMAPPDAGPELDFPTLGDAPRSRQQIGISTANRTVQLDPARTRFSGAVKYGQKVQVPLPNRTPQANPMDRNGLPQPRKSARITLRPPALLPTLPTGQSLANLYIRYRQTFLELGANRNKCLAKAAECFKRGDGAGARKWSREAQDWSRQVAIEGRDSALRIVEERKKVLREAIERNEGRSGSTDDVPDRKAKGQERGGGICLGVISSSMLSSNERLSTEEERTEVALDLHALHTDEAISFMGDFLLKLEAQQFRGIAYIVIGQQKHSGSSAPDKGEAAGRLRLEQATTEFLGDQGWAWQNYGGILAIDCLR